MVVLLSQVASQLVRKAELACERLALQLRAAPSAANNPRRLSQGLHSITQQALLRSQGSLLAASVSVQSAITSSRSGSYTGTTSMSASLSASTASFSRSQSVSQPDSPGCCTSQPVDSKERAGARSPAAPRQVQGTQDVTSVHMTVSCTEHVTRRRSVRDSLHATTHTSNQKRATLDTRGSVMHQSASRRCLTDPHPHGPAEQRMQLGGMHSLHSERTPAASKGHAAQQFESMAAPTAVEPEAGVQADQHSQHPEMRSKRLHRRASLSPSSPGDHRPTKYRSRMGPRDDMLLSATGQLDTAALHDLPQTRTMHIRACLTMSQMTH